MRRVTSLLTLLLFFSITVFSQSASTGLANEMQGNDPGIDMLKMEQMQNTAAEVQPGIVPGDNQSNGNHFSKYQGGDQSRDVLWDNGPFVTAAGVGSNGTDYSELQDASLGMGTFGSGVQISAGNSLADDFDVAGTWNVTSFTFYAYQTGSGPPSTLNDVRVQVWDGDPTDGGTIIFGDLTTNVILSTDWTNAWRVLESLPEENRPIMEIVADASGLFLTPGTYWVEYSIGGTGASGPWNPAVTIVGETTTGNALQNQAGLWVVLEDVGPQGVPFLVEGTIGSQPANDITVQSITEPNSGVDLTAAEPVMFMIKNNGTDVQSDVPWEVTWNGTATGSLSGTYAGPLGAGETAEIDAGTADVSAYGDYTFEACANNPGDEYPDNNCKTKLVTNAEPTLCIEGLYSSGCGFGDGLISWDLANINVPDIPCVGTPPWYHDYTDQIHQLTPGMDYTLTVVAGYTSTNVDVWIDFNDDLDLTDDELVLDDAACPEGNVPYTFTITIPAGATPGEHLLRYRTNWISVVADACETYSYGNASDFTANLGEPAAADVGVTSIDVPAFVEPGVVEMYATVNNFGTDTQTFDVTLTDEVLDYSSTMTVTDLAGGESVQVMFDNWNATNGVYNFEACTALAGDENPDNDCATATVTIQETFNVFAYNAYDPTATIVEGPFTFDLGNPGVATLLAPTTSDQFISGGCYAPGDMWYGSQYFDGTLGGGIWEIDQTNGDMTFIGGTGDFTGLAHDGATLFGASITDLYTIDPLTGAETLVGPMNNPSALMIGIGCNQGGDLFGFDIGDDTFFSIDKVTGAATAIGPLGFDYNFAQDMSFDKENDMCYLSGYTSAGGLYSVDVTTGAATYIADFQGGMEVTAFAIPYDYPSFDNDLGIMAIVSPETGYNLTDMEDVTVTIKNYGEVAQSGFDVTYSFATDNPVTETVAETIEPGATLDHTFTVPADLSAYGDYNFTICTELDGDQNPDNDCKEKLVQNLEFGEITGSTKNANNNAALVGVLIEAGGFSTVSAGGPFGAFYTLVDLPAGTYNVVASKEGFFTATYPDVEVLPGQSTTLNISLVPDLPLALPFMEMWDDTSFMTNLWAFDPDVNNWQLDDGNGNPAPSAEFYWSPSQTDYEHAMTSRKLEGVPAKATEVILFEYDLYLNNYSLATIEGMGVEVWDGTDWVEVANYDNQGGDIPFTTFAHNITDLVTGIDFFQVRFRAYGANTFNINWWWLDNIKVYQTTFVNFSGTITELSTGNPIEGATIMLDNTRIDVVTGPDGTFSVDIQGGTYDVMLTADGYNPVTAEGVEITEDFVWDVAMTAPTLEVAPAAFTEELELGVSQDYNINVANNGNGPVDWTANVQFASKSSGFNVFVPESVSTANVEEYGKRVKPQGNLTDAMFDLQFSFDAETASGLTGLAGAECDGNYFYATKWASNQFVKYELDGTFIEIFTIDGVTGIRDLAFDGTYFYGSNATSTIYEMDFTNKTLVSTIAAAGPARAIAYDNINDGFWCNNWDSPMLLIGRDGSQLNDIPGVPSIYGAAFDPYTAGGPYLWLNAGTTAGGGNWVEQWDIATKSFTGVMHSVSDDLGPDFIAGGLFLVEDVVPGTYTLGGLAQGAPSLIYGYELGMTSAPWLSLDVTSGSLTGSKAAEDITMTLNTADLELGLTYYADIVFSSSPDVGDVVVPVELFVTGDLGFIEGMVTDPMSRAGVAGATVTADNGVDMFTATSGADGSYYLPVLAGTYDVMAEKENYIMDMVEGLEVPLDATVVQDFMLEFAPPVLLSAEGSYFDVALEWEGNPLLSGGGKDVSRALATNVKVMGTKPAPVVYDQSKYPDMTRQGGDAIADAFVIPALPYNTSGTTTGYTDDYDEVCPASSTSPDVVYAYTPAQDELLNIDLCGSLYDTKLFVYENELTAGAPYACDDDYYGFGDPCGNWVSAIFDLFVTGGNTYYIVVDGYGGGSGDYLIDVYAEVYNPCVVECPAGAIAEGEDCPADEYVDNFNGGCNADVPVFTSVNCGDVVCGTASTFMFEGLNYRDTDWYELVITEPQVVSFAVTAEFPVIGGLIEQVNPGVPGCDNTTGFIAPFGSADACEELALEMTLTPGTYYFFVAPGVFEGYPCGTSNDYVASWTCSETFLSYYNLYRDGVDIADVYGTTYMDMDVEPGSTYCYTVDQVFEPGMMTGESNEICADVLYAPEISTNPVELFEDLEPGQSSTQVLTLENLGLGDLDWTAEVLTAKGRTSAQLGAYPVPTMTQEQSEDLNPEDVFKVPGENVPLAGTRDVLYDNGPLVTGTCAATGDPESMVQAPQTVLGVNFNNAAGWSVADDFTVDGEWTVESFEFFGYQTGGGIPSTLTAVFVTVWDGDPMNGGQVIWGDQVTDIFVSTEWAGAYRVGATTSCNTARAIHKIVADAGGLTLSAGTYWLEWSVTGTATSGPWSPVVSEVGVAPDGNGLSNNSSGVWSPYSSGGVGVEWPFIINGGAGEPWLTIDQTGGTLLPDGSLDINVGFNAADLGPGTYNGMISFMSNDPLLPVLDVPVELVVYLNEGTLAGYVTDATSRGPVEGVTITADGIRETTTTDEFGYYELLLPVGNYSVTAAKAGYQSQTIEPVTIEFDQTTQQDFMLEFAGPVLLYADGGVGVINLGWESNPSARGAEVHPSYADVQIPARKSGEVVYDQSKYPDMSRQGGDAIADATVIPGIPYNNTGTTVGYTDDYDEQCTSASTSPDVVYSFTPASDIEVDIDLCGSLYDTKIFVYENELTAGDPFACNDDFYGSGDPCGSYVSALFGLALTGGNTYYIVVDGWGGDSGEYTIDVSEYNACVVECPSGAIDEGEPCGEDLNGGCNADVFAVTPINDGDVICGTAWAEAGRDTDWYELVITEPKTVTWTATAEFPVLIFIIDGNFGCEGLEIITSATAAPCDEAVATADLVPGTYWLWVGDQAFDGNPCGSGSNNYVAEVTSADIFITYYNVFRDDEQIATTYYDFYTDADIMPDTEYCYKVDQVIEPGLNTPFSNELCATMLCEMACDYTFNFYDTYGDTWNGALISVFQGGAFIGDFTHTSGPSSSLMVSLCDGLETSLQWTAGTWDEECGFELIDPLGNILFSFEAPNAPVPGEFFLFTTECPQMLTQNIPMEQDWNAWSSYVAPAERVGMEEMMDPIIDEMIITQYFSELYYPEYGIMTMGDYTNQHGYFTKMSAAATLPMSGFMADPTVTVPAGWSLFPVLQECSIAAADVFSNIPGLVIAWDPVGNGIYYPTGNLYTLVDLNPGMAYWIKVDAETSYTYPGCTKASGANSTSLRPVNNTSWNDVNFTPVNHAVIFDANATVALQEGDMIGAFTSNNWCAGMVEYTGANLGLNLFGDDLTTDMADGFIEGESLTFRLFRPATEEEFEIDVTYDYEAPNAEGMFAINGISVITDLKLSPTSIGENMLNGLNIYPNPSSGIFNIAIGNLDEEIDFVVLNAQGQEVYNGSLTESQQLDLSAEPKGVYFIKFINESVLGIEKLVIK